MAELRTDGTKETLNQEIKNLLETVNTTYQVNILENELRYLIDVHEDEYLFSLGIEYTWLMEEKEKDNYKDLASAVYEEYLETYLK